MKVSERSIYTPNDKNEDVQCSEDDLKQALLQNDVPEKVLAWLK